MWLNFHYSIYIIYYLSRQKMCRGLSWPAANSRMHTLPKKNDIDCWSRINFSYQSIFETKFISFVSKEKEKMSKEEAQGLNMVGYCCCWAAFYQAIRAPISISHGQYGLIGDILGVYSLNNLYICNLLIYLFFCENFALVILFFHSYFEL